MGGGGHRIDQRPKVGIGKRSPVDRGGSSGLVIWPGRGSETKEVVGFLHLPVGGFCRQFQVVNSVDNGEGP